MRHNWIITAALAALTAAPAAARTADVTITNGVPWYDDRDSVVSAHGANIIYDGGKYYMFGEYKTDSANVFVGFSCYSSPDLANWRFERIALPAVPAGRLGPDRVGERPKVMRCPKTGEYVMLAHSDDRRYKDLCVVYATSPTVNGEYTYRGPLLYKGKPIKRWDIGSFMDDDGHGYLLADHGRIYRLGDDFHSADSCMMNGLKGAGKSPAMFKKDGIYYWLSSHTTSWERNDNMYHTSRSLAGPWEARGAFCPEGTLTHNSQTSFVLPIVVGTDTVPVFMGDRWSFPRQHSAATYVWLPATVADGRFSVPAYMEAWSPATMTATEVTGRTVGGRFASDRPGDALRLKFKGRKVGVRGTAGPDCCYARIVIKDRKGRTVTDQFVDFYAKMPSPGLRFVSRWLPEGEYTIEISVTGFKPVWTDKTRRVYGSKGTAVRVDDVFVIDK